MAEHDQPGKLFHKAKINPDLVEKMDGLKEDERLRVLIKMEQKTKLSRTATPASTIQRLKETARQSQEPVLHYLNKGFRTSEDRKTKGFWIANLIFAEVTKDEIKHLAELVGVREIYADYRLEVHAERVNREKLPVWDHIGFMKAPEAWAQGYRGQQVRVAVVDTGIDITHPELRGALGGEAPYYEGFWAEFDEAGEMVKYSKPHDSDEHGTHVSGTIGGRNVRQRIGVAPEAILAHALILPGGGGTLPQVLAGLQWVAEQRFDVVNGSFGIDTKSQDLLEAVENLVLMGVFPVFAIGNSGPGITSAPGNAPMAEAVGAFDSEGAVADFSGGGMVEYARYPYSDPMMKIKPDIVAPGVEITSAIPDGAYAVFNGTSMATPHVAGVVALLKSRNPALSIQQIKDILHRSVGGFPGLHNDPGGSTKDVRYGWGRLNALQAVTHVPDQRSVCYVQGYVLGEKEFVDGATLIFAGPEVKQLTTNAHGFYQGTLQEGMYQVTVQALAYRPYTQEITVVFGEGKIINIQLESAPSGWIVGEVMGEQNREWLPDVKVEVSGTPLHTKTNAEGVYKLQLNEGKYSVRFSLDGYHSIVREDVLVKPDRVVELNTFLPLDQKESS